MKRHELISGQLVKVRKGEWYIVIGDQLCCNKGLIQITSYDNNLDNINHKDYDIVEVYNPRKGNYLFSLIRAQEDKKIDNELLWKRTPVIDWSKVKQNDPIKIVDKGDFYMVRHFHSIENGIVRVIPDGKTTFTSDDGDCVVAKEIVLDFSHFELIEK